ncbi:MAG: hypothetical protein JWP87_3331 [Labilithrix sp.]|nr:hypothetical protein [Labilithrix sp.]
MRSVVALAIARDIRVTWASMWLDAISVVVILATGDPDDGSTRAIEQALHSALGNDAVVTIRSASRDSAAGASPSDDGAALVGVVSWSDRQKRATIHVTNARDGRSSDREIRFDPADVASERGRTIGFALASMVPAEALATNDAPKPATAETMPIAPRAEATPVPPAEPSERPPSLPRPNGMAVDASAVATTALAGYGGGFGGVFAFRLPLAGAIGARVALGARGGDVAPAQATSRVFSGGVGLTWQPWLDARRRWAAGARFDALLLHHQLTHLSDDDPESVRLSRFVPGFDAALEGAFRFAGQALVVMAVGSEVALGRTEVLVRQHEAATLSPVRIFGEMGVRVAF